MTDYRCGRMNVQRKSVKSRIILLGMKELEEA